MASIEGMDRVGCTADTGSGSTDGGEGHAPGVRAVADGGLGYGSGVRIGRHRCNWQYGCKRTVRGNA